VLVKIETSEEKTDVYLIPPSTNWRKKYSKLLKRCRTREIYRRSSVGFSSGTELIAREFGNVSFENYF